MSDNEPWSEQFRVAALKHADLEAAAHMLEEAKTAVLAQRKAQQGDLPDSHSERIVKASPSWYDYIEKMVKARQAANLAKVEVDYIKMKFWEWQSANANNRVEARL